MGRRSIGILAALAVVGIAAALLIRPAPLPDGIHAEDVVVPDPADRPLTVRIWYPDEPAGNLPLIVFSHGTGGAETGHADTAVALAGSGFVVAAVRHTGDNYRDASYVGRGMHLIGRPRHVSRTIDYMLGQWPGRGRIDSARIGLFGHSAGGFTALVVAGGEPDLSRGAAHCRAEPRAWDCLYLKRNGFDPSRRRPAPAWNHDARVGAAVIAAPAVGYAFEPDRLAKVALPIQLWEAGQDRIVDRGATIVRTLLPQPSEYHLLPKAGHFSFLQPCDAAMRVVITVMTLSGTPHVCEDPPDFDRAAFHRTFNRDVAIFFHRALGAAPR